MRLGVEAEVRASFGVLPAPALEVSRIARMAPVMILGPNPHRRDVGQVIHARHHHLTITPGLLRARKDTEGERTTQYVDALHWVTSIATEIRKLPIHTLAVIHGKVIGGGLALAICC